MHHKYTSSRIDVGSPRSTSLMNIFQSSQSTMKTEIITELISEKSKSVSARICNQKPEPVKIKKTQKIKHMKKKKKSKKKKKKIKSNLCTLGAQLPPWWNLRSRIAAPRAPPRNQASHVRSRLAAGCVWCRLTLSQVTVLEVTFL